jgi:hypothetical protein
MRSLITFGLPKAEKEMMAVRMMMVMVSEKSMIEIGIYL